MTTPLQDPLARASRRRLGAAALVLVAACQAAPRAPMTQAPDPTAGPSMASAPPSPPGSAPREERPASLRDLAPPTRVTLPLEVRPVGNQAGALLVAQEEGRAFVRLLDRDGALSAPRLVAGRQVVSAHVGEAPLLLTAEGDDRLCVERLDREDAPRCSRARADRALTLGGALWLLEERTADEEVEAGPREAGDPAKRRPGEAKEPAPRGDQRPGEDVQIWGRKLETDGFGEPKRIGLGFARPLAGMGLLDAVGHDAGAHVVWYEARRERREGTRGIPQAALRRGRLDRTGRFVAASAADLRKGDRGYGHLEGHVDAALYVAGKRGVLVGRFVDEKASPSTGFEALALGSRRPMEAPASLFGVAPWRLAEERPVPAAEQAALHTLWSLGPRLHHEQSPAGMGRVAWAGGRGVHLLKDRPPDRVFLWQSGEGDRELEPPFVAERSRLRWGHLEADGEGLAIVDDALVRIPANGNPVRTGAAGPIPRRAPARVGASWWAVIPEAGPGSGEALVRWGERWGDEARQAGTFPLPGPSAVAGGAEVGLVVSLVHGGLRLHRLPATGAPEPLGDLPSDLRHGIWAAPRRGGGALVVGLAERKRRVVVVAIDAEGRRLGEASTTLRPAVPLQIRALPQGGAILSDASREQVLWLDDAGVERAHAAWPSERVAAACLDGEPAPRLVPSEIPGRFVTTGAPDNRCVSAVVPAAGGRYRWLGSEVEGLGSRAVVGEVVVEGDPPSPMASTARDPSPVAPASLPSHPCPPEMVSIAGRYCIDRFEAQLVGGDGVPLSPDYPTSPRLVGIILGVWTADRWTTGDLHARAMPLPPLLRAPEDAPRVIARSRQGVTPSGYVSGLVAAQACEAAGKRLCTKEEWGRACRGEADRKFPYGDDYRQGVCNVFRYAHPAATLHDNPAVGHLDPRLNRVLESEAPLLETTGARPRCASRWGDDAVYDMVGNLDEWLDDDKGAFAGGFYSRSSRSGCDALVTAHPRRYLDYSLGIRCCAAARP